MLRWLDLKNNPLLPKLAEIAGPCLDEQQCQQSARKVVTFLHTMQIQVAEERERRLRQKRKQQGVIFKHIYQNGHNFAGGMFCLIACSAVTLTTQT
jgi:hypothetical protein